MGVRGLTTYVNMHEEMFLKYYLLHDTNLVIDGNSLCCQLLNNMNSFWAFGGDYDQYVVVIKRFFQNLRKCNIKSYILFDGCYEKRKIKTAYRRLKSKLDGASKLNPVTQTSLQIFPLLVLNVFKEVLDNLKIPYTICEFEADDEIAALSRYLKCPVLSYDSDYFIYNVLYVPFNHLNLVPQQFQENSKKYFALPCKLYKVEYLLQHFGGLKKELLPLLATLLGNDFVEKSVFKHFFSQLKLPNKKKKANEQQRCIQGVFKWLEHESLDSAVKKILGRLRKTKKHKVYCIIKQSIEGYNRLDCKSLSYFDFENVTAPLPPDLTLCTDVLSIDENIVEEVLEQNEDTDKGENGNSNSGTESTDSSMESIMEKERNVLQKKKALRDISLNYLPEWLIKCIRNGLIPQQYLNLYTHHLYFCYAQAEDYNDNDAFLCALPILRYAFDILTNFAGENFTYVCREKQNYKRIIIDEEYSICKPLQLDKENLLENPRLIIYFEEFLKACFTSLDFSILNVLPDNFQLYMLSILWWVSRCDISGPYVYSLLFCYIMLEVIDEKTGTFRGHHFFNNKYSKKIKELQKGPVPQYTPCNDKLFLNKNKVLYEDSIVAASVLLQHFELSDEIKKRPTTYNRKRVHRYAQFQCCLQQFNCLNVLCRKKYQCTNYGKCFNGTFVYNMCTKLEKCIDPLAFIDQYLKGAHTVLWFFKSLLNVYERCTEQLGISMPKSGNLLGRKKKRRKKSKDEMFFLYEEFKSEVVI